MAICPGTPGLAGTRMSPFWILLELMYDRGGGDKWSYKMCKAPGTSSPSMNQHSTFYRPDALPVAQPTASEHWRNIFMLNIIQYYRCCNSTGKTQKWVLPYWTNNFIKPKNHKIPVHRQQCIFCYIQQKCWSLRHENNDKNTHPTTSRGSKRKGEEGNR